MKPRTSIILPTYNQAHFLSEALNSIFVQTDRDFELIVVDDGSADSTGNLLTEFQSHHEFTVVRQDNQGLPGALNTGFTRARGAYLTWTSADNILAQDMVEVLVHALERNPSIGLVYADRYLMDENGKDLGLFGLPEYDPDLLLHVNLVHCCFMYRRECMEMVGGYDPQFIYGEDWEYWIRISEHFQMLHVPLPLYRYRIHAKSMTSDLVRGSARHLGYSEFSARVRRRMFRRWWIGKLRWWWLILTNPDHPVVRERAAWQTLASRAANTTSGLKVTNQRHQANESPH